MSQRRELLTRIAGLGDIRDILGAMKGLALVELHRIGEMIESQWASVHEIERALADFMQFHGAPLAPARSSREVWCVVGSERGFCGDFNTRIAEAARSGRPERPQPERIILMGTKLADSWPDADGRCVHVAAPSIADEVPAALSALLTAFEQIVAERPAEAVRLTVLHDGSQGIRVRTLLPVPEPSAAPTKHAFPPLLTLPPRACFEGLTDHYLYAMLHELLFDSLMEENRRRLQHMDQALRRLDDQLQLLQRQHNRQRQEEIIEEIEVILLTAG